MFIPLFLGFKRVSTCFNYPTMVAQDLAGPSTDKMLMTCRRNEEFLTTKYGDMQQDMGR